MWLLVGCLLLGPWKEGSLWAAEGSLAEKDLPAENPDKEASYSSAGQRESLGWPVKFRVRIVWGGGPERRWSGRIWVQPGTVSQPEPLALEADAPGSVWVEAGQVHVRPWTPRSFDGVDVWVEGLEQSKLTIELKPEGEADSGRPARGFIEVELGRLKQEAVSAALDQQGTEILVQRSPGDTLRVVLPGDSAVFSPGQIVPIRIQPYFLPVAAGSRLEMQVRLFRADSSEAVWDFRKEFAGGDNPSLEVQVPLGNAEGVYELAIEVTEAEARPWAFGWRGPLPWRGPIAQRRVQLVVIHPRSGGRVGAEEGRFSVVAEIDPANPKWFERFAKLPVLPGLPRLWGGPVGNHRQESVSHPLGQLCRLQPNPNPQDVSWEAYSLPTNQPGKPHLLEVRYPSDQPQTFAIRIVEPTRSGLVRPIGPESGVHLTEEVISSRKSPRWLEHRMLFWPQSPTPMVVISNCRTDAPALYGRIRLLAGPEHLPGLPAWPAPHPSRKYYAYLHRPWFTRTFGAPEAKDSGSEEALENWTTFYIGALRLVEALRYGGYDGLVLSVVADGSSLYPSQLLQPSPRYDMGILSQTGPDPVRKDVLEMLFRIFDREGLTLVPMVEFVAPLPRLEARCRQQEAQRSGLRWIGPEGKEWTEVFSPSGGRAPYYNLLHQEVQNALLEVLQELISRYSHHPAMGGLALQLSGSGYGQLRGPEWGMDDHTIAQFQQDTHLELPATGPERFSQRAKLLTGVYRQKWLQWRSAQLSKFYQKVDRMLKSARPEARLYLLAGDLWTDTYWEAALRPVLARRTTAADLLLQVGLDLRHYHHPDGPILVRPEPSAPAARWGRQALYMEWRQLVETEQAFATMPMAGSLFVRHPEKILLPSFDQQNPFRSKDFTLWSQPIPADRQNRRRFVQSLAALDSQILLDGGWFFPLGGHESLQDLVLAYRRLPAIRFQTAEPAPGTANSQQPVVIRYGYHENYTFIYLVNPTPIPFLVRMKLQGARTTRAEELSGRRSLQPLVMEADGYLWTVELEGYDFLAARLLGEKIRPVLLEQRPPSGLEDQLEDRIRRLSTQAAMLRNPPLWSELKNPGFEEGPLADGSIPHWLTTRGPQTSIQLEREGAREGKKCVHMISKGAIACLVSRPFPAPPTGRFAMIVWLRTADAQHQPPLRLAVEWEQNGRQYRYASVGAGENGQNVPLSTQWVPYVFQVYDLPLNESVSIQVRFDLMGEGEVWIDDVQISGLAFTRDELIELSKLLTVASAKLEEGQLADCLRILEGYWPRFLQTYVSAGWETLGRRASWSAGSPRVDGERSSNVLDRLKNFLPRPLRF